MKTIAYLLIFFACGSAMAADRGSALCDSIVGGDQAACRAALHLLIQGGPYDPNPSIFAAASAGRWLFRYQALQVPDGKPRCAILVDHLVVPQDRKTRLLFTSQDDMLDFDIVDLGISKTAVPGRISETVIDNTQFDGDLSSKSSLDKTGDHGSGIRFDMLQPAAYSAWQQQTIKHDCTVTE